MRLSRESQRFLEQYGRDLASRQAASITARDVVTSVLRDAGAHFDGVSARTKTIDSLRAKLRKKRYGQPGDEITDCIGVRVVTYHESEIDVAVRALSVAFEIDSSRSVDKRTLLGLREFGYNSAHLIVRLRESRAQFPEYRHLGRQWFEIQVRSILEHAWAQIEHEIVYKSGVLYPEPVRRRFAALAGAIEILEKEFLSLRQEKDRLVDSYVDDYREGRRLTEEFDVARLLAYLEVARPRGLGWRAAATAGKPLQAGTEQSCVEALSTVRLDTPQRLAVIMGTRSFAAAVKSFAAAASVAVAVVPHLSIAVIAIAFRSVKVLEQHFPEMIYDPLLSDVVSTIRRRAKTETKGRRRGKT